MKKYLFILLTSLSCMAAPAAPQVAESALPQTTTAWWDWLPNPADLGGMTTNQYYTNIVFHLFSSVNCQTPTNQWPNVTNWLAATFPSADGHWTNYVVLDGNTRFFLLTVGAVNGGASPFSNQAVLVATPPPGLLRKVGLGP